MSKKQAKTTDFIKEMREYFPDFPYEEATKYARQGCKCCQGHGFLLFELVNGSRFLKLCNKSMCSEHNLQKKEEVSLALR